MPHRVLRPALFALVLASACDSASTDVTPPETVQQETPEAPPPYEALAPGMGRWSSVMPWPDIAIHLTVMPDGQVLSWGGSEGVEDPTYGTTADLWDPATNTHTPVPHLDVDVFCSGHAFDAAGKLIVTGGHVHDSVGVRGTFVFDGQQRSWTRGPEMRHGRWYPTNTTLRDGSIAIIAGTDEEKRTNLVPEIWENGKLRELTGASMFRHFYPRTFLAPDGRLVLTGPERMTQYLSTEGTGSWTSGPRMSYERDYGSAVLVDGKVLATGGGYPPTALTDILDLNAPNPVWTATAPMAYARRQLNLVILPNGRVMAVGGTSGDGFNNAIGSVYAGEIYDFQTGQWTTVASQQVQRLYHSVAALLPDGRVISAGGGRPRASNGGGTHLNAEIFTPSYLLDANGAPAVRPSITSVPERIQYGKKFKVATPDAESIAKITLIRLPSVTHAFDQNQRLTTLSFMRVGKQLDVAAPEHGAIAPPGHYMLFILTRTGVPSIAKIVRIE